MNRLAHAQYLATHEHVIKRQQLYQSLPYTHHLAAVAGIVASTIRDDEDLQIAAWLHDLVEDCPGMKAKHVEEHFGERVAKLVEAVTNEPGPNRKTRHALTYPKIRTTPDAVIIKLADRLANIQAGGNLVGMYRKEHADFKHALSDSLVSRAEYLTVVEDLWSALDKLLFDRRESPRPEMEHHDDRRDSDRHPPMSV